MITIAGDKVVVSEGDVQSEHDIGSPEAFAILSRLWLRAGWDAKYVYSFTWLGRPIIQLPEDLIRIQEVIYRIKPDVIIETGVAHGGSLVFYASLLAAMGHGRAIGIDVEIRPQNRAAIESHPLSERITLIEADSIAPDTVDRVAGEVGRPKAALVILDSKHTRDHVLSELRLYSRFVTVDSYIVAADGIMEAVAGAPRTSPDWTWNNPRRAIAEFLKENSDFEISEPAWPFNEGMVTSRVTYWPDAFLRRVR